MLELLLVLVNSGAIQLTIGYAILALFEVVLVQIFHRRRIILNAINKPPIWLLLIANLIYGGWKWALGDRLGFSLIIYTIVPVLAFIAGYTITNTRKVSSISYAKRCIAAIVVGCGLHISLNVATNMGITSRGMTADFFTGTLAATNLGSVNTCIFALLPCLIITTNKKIKIIGLILFGIAVAYAFMIGTRTQVYILIVLVLLSVFIYLRRHYAHGVKLKTIVKWGVVWTLVIAAVTCVYTSDFMGIQTGIKASLLVGRYRDVATAGSDATRMKMFFAGLRNLYQHPLGGDYLVNYTYYHNYWLDFGRVAGTLPVVLIAVMDLIFIRHMFWIFKNRSIDEDLRYAMFGLYVCCFLNFFMEPIMDGYLDLFYRFTLINGLTEGLYDQMKRKTAKTIEPCVPLDVGIVKARE